MFDPYRINPSPGPGTYSPVRNLKQTHSYIGKRYTLPPRDHIGDAGKYLLPSTLYNNQRNFGYRPQFIT